MTTKADIQRKIGEALDSVSGIQRADPGDFFYARLLARWEREEKSTWTQLGRLIARPVVAFSSVALVLLINAFVLVATESTTPDLREVVMLDEYRSSISDYDLENIQP